MRDRNRAFSTRSFLFSRCSCFVTLYRDINDRLPNSKTAGSISSPVPAFRTFRAFLPTPTMPLWEERVPRSRWLPPPSHGIARIMGMPWQARNRGLGDIEQPGDGLLALTALEPLDCLLALMRRWPRRGGALEPRPDRGGECLEMQNCAVNSHVIADWYGALMEKCAVNSHVMPTAALMGHASVARIPGRTRGPQAPRK
jgi:hypothetical protein